MFSGGKRLSRTLRGHVPPRLLVSVNIRGHSMYVDDVWGYASKVMSPCFVVNGW
jgi:hypothetical protein